MGVVVVFEVSRQVARRLSLAAELPTGHPAVFDEIGALVDGLPDPQWLCAEERAGSIAVVARLRDRFDAYLADLAGAANRHPLGVSQVSVLIETTTRAPPRTA